MKKIFTLCIALLVGGQLIAQKVGPDQLDQIKRKSRSFNYIEKTYTGTVEKLIYSFQTLGGPLNAMIFRKSDGKLTFIDFKKWHGKSFKPFLKEGQSATITVTGDPLLLDVILYKGEYIRQMEFAMREQLFGMGNLVSVEAEKGSMSVDKMDPELLKQRFGSKVSNVFNARVKDRVNLNEKEFLILLSNGDSLLMKKSTETDLNEIPEVVSYVKEVRNELNPNFYKNPNTYPVSQGKADQILMYQYGVILYKNRLLSIKKVSLDKFTDSNNGISNSLQAVDNAGNIISLKFRQYQGQIINDILMINDATVHLLPLDNNEFRILGIDNGNEIIEVERIIKSANVDLYNKPLSTHSGIITEIFKVSFEGIERISGVIIDDSLYLDIPSNTGISIGKSLKQGDEIKFTGYERKKIPGELILKKLRIFYPNTIEIGRKVFEINRKPFR